EESNLSPNLVEKSPHISETKTPSQNRSIGNLPTKKPGLN
ncbi:MAG: hypothetical protein ACI9ZV_000638, partial [Candidatus Azotimanducaceae bacterium]